MAVEGVTALQRKLALIPKTVIEEIKKELEKQAEDLVQMMRRVAPRGETGALVASIRWTWGEAPRGTISVGTVASSEGSDVRITIYAGGKVGVDDAFYARFQEFGTKNMPANPFFFPSYRAKKKAIRGGLTRAMKRGVKNAV